MSTTNSGGVCMSVYVCLCMCVHECSMYVLYSYSFCRPCKNHSFHNTMLPIYQPAKFVTLTNSLLLVGVIPELCDFALLAI